MVDPLPSERMHGLDTVRAGALILGVAFHATLAYLPGGLAAVQDKVSLPLMVFAFTSHLFRMNLFFLVAGFFARLLIKRRGVHGFISNRTTRIVLPLIAFWPASFLAITSAFSWGRTVDKQVLQVTFPSLNLLTVPLTHLWFLYYLSLFYIAALILKSSAERVDPEEKHTRRIDAALTKLFSWRSAAIGLAIPIMLVCAHASNWSPGQGIPTPDVGLVPRLMPFGAFGAAFAVGWFLQRQPVLFEFLREQWAAHLAVGAGLTGLLFMQTLASGGQFPSHLERSVEAGVYGLTTWCWTLGLLGAALKFHLGERAGIRYLADASYWIYIIHMPLVFALQTLLFPTDWHPVAKFLLVFGGVLAVATGSYRAFVRYTWLGAWLNGRRKQASVAEPVQA